MTFGAPLYLAAGALAALIVTALHFLARQRPRTAPFPTARFIPERTARAPSRALRPSDLLLLALRVLALISVAAAFARPAWDASRRGTARVLLVDRSRAALGAAELRDSALAQFRDGDALLLFDSAAHLVPGSARDTLRALTLVNAAGSLSAALVAANSGAVTMAPAADSVELVIVSPLTVEEWDAATPAIRALWPGRIEVVRVSAAPPVTRRGAGEIRGAGDDVLRTAGLGLGLGLGSRVVRGRATPDDSAWAATPGATLVIWPAHFDAPVLDTIGALVIGDDVVVGPFTRYSLPRPRPSPVVIARWSDGAPAATEIPAGGGCIRDLAIPIPEPGDLVLRESFRRVAARLLAPCGGARGAPPASDSLVAALRGAGALAGAREFASAERSAPPLTAWLLATAAVLLLAEPLLRRRAA